MTGAVVSRGVGLSVAAAVAALVGCVEPLAPGELGVARYLGEVAGDAPVIALAPRTDVRGNTYVVVAGRDPTRTETFVAHVDGAVTRGCAQAQGGAGGWVGTDVDRAWYWAAEALVALDGSTGACQVLLDTDPDTGRDLGVLSVAPAIWRDRGTVLAIAALSIADDERPWLATVDLLAGRLVAARPLDGAVVLGSGARDDRATFLVERAGQLEAHAVDLDLRGTVVALGAAPAGGHGPLTLQPRGAALLGLLATDDGAALVRLDGAVGEVQALPPNAAPTAMHVHDGTAWLVGERAGRPTVAPLEAPLAELPWVVSEDLAATLAAGLDVLDLRDGVRRRLDWPSARAATGAWPLVTADLEAYAVDTAALLVAGPPRDTGGQRVTPLALVPVGVSYP